jgi:hypothetical protein
VAADLVHGPIEAPQDVGLKPADCIRPVSPALADPCFRVERASDELDISRIDTERESNGQLGNLKSGLDCRKPTVCIHSDLPTAQLHSFARTRRDYRRKDMAIVELRLLSYVSNTATA